MKTKLLFLNALLITTTMAQDPMEINLPTSIINSDYIEGKKLQGSKNIIIIDQKNIQGKGYSSVSEILNDVPSITVGQSGWGEIDIRGQGADQAAKNIQVMIDGAPITTLVNHPFQTNYNTIPVDQIERIEIIPGGGAVLYGNGASGGVINISTNLKKLDKPKTGFGYEYSDTNKKRYFVNAGSKINDNFSFQLNYSKDDEDLYFTDTYRSSEYFSGGFNYKLTNNQSLSLKYSKFLENGQFIKNVSKSNLEKYGKDYKPSYKTTTIGIDKNGERIRVKERGYLSSNRENEILNGSYIYQINDKTKFIFDMFKDNGYFTNNNDGNKKMTQDTIGTKSKLDFSYGKANNLLIGIDYYTQKANLTYPDFIRQKDANGKTMYNKYEKIMYRERELSFDYEREVKALYFLNKIAFNNLEFTQGVRHDITTWNFEKNAHDGKGKDTRENKNNAYELSVAWLYRDTGRVYTRYERGFTGPDGVQISDRVYNSQGNREYIKTNAQDEIFDMYEIGLRDYIWGSTFNLTAFYTETNNQLNRLYIKNPKGQREYRTLNLLKTYRYGIETSLSQEIGKFTFEESYAWLKGKTDYNSTGERFLDEGNKIDWEDSGLKKVPEHNVVLSAKYNFTNYLKGGITYKYTGGYNNYLKQADREEDSLVKSNSITNLSLTYEKDTLGLTIYGGINNIFNENYYSYVSDGFSTVIPAQGRSLYTGFKYNF